MRCSAAPGDGKWLQMDQELETRNGQTVGTSKPTGHNVLVDSRETNRLDEGMIIELWSKGVLWDRLLGVHFMPLTDVRYWWEFSAISRCLLIEERFSRAAPGDGKWLQMDQELETRNGQTVGTSKPTGHNVLVDSRFELPFESLKERSQIVSKVAK
ncbi:hypothetical protein ANCCEY_05237 [Ancylostoma ceylanicum]|uniref:Uncharacterized protein n=1 Tax=Ancylostoma ceylanicum TaxID=53326 RepID=A0A0D6M719_9BILA|nr:hypothetical protein ANCCEY_05237 [Ancylostoma ceylanicum]